MRALAAAFAAACVIATPACAFDCGGTLGAVERAICADPAAKSADDAMNAAFASVKAASDTAQAAQLLADQRVWLKDRNTRCGTRDAAGCLREADAERAAYLQGRPKAGPGTPEPLVPLIVSLKNSKTTYAVTIRLLRFANARTPAQTRFNGLMDKIARDTPKAIGADDAGSDTSMFFAERLATVAYASDRLLSVVVLSSDETGGAHPNSGSQTINIDMRTGQRLSIDDLLPADKRGEVVSLCGAHVAQQWKDKQREQGENPDSKSARDEVATWAKDGAAGLKSTTTYLANWSFGADKAVITYDAYAVGPYAMGAFSCDLPYEQVRRLAKPGFPLP